uniref:Uncharacterized protein n=1 Tax=Cacopsylla melanoneura TaxID=428564 RepID=A0A8D8UY86_9HEMI
MTSFSVYRVGTSKRKHRCFQFSIYRQFDVSYEKHRCRYKYVFHYLILPTFLALRTLPNVLWAPFLEAGLPDWGFLVPKGGQKYLLGYRVLSLRLLYSSMVLGANIWVVVCLHSTTVTLMKVSLVSLGSQC